MPMFNPAHPGRILRNFISKDLTVTAAAKHLNVPRENLSKILNGRQSISAAVAVKLGEAFPKHNAEFWLRLQMQYDLAQIRKKKRTKIEPLDLAEAA